MVNKILVKWINLAAIGALIPFINKYPILQTILSRSKHPSSDWDFFMTVAGVGMYLSIKKVNKEEYKEIENQLLA
ncbi:MAG: hypothetical protein PHC43_10255, partial [Candidatus Marinimicrobia bacterium]|nr:hypothetical protein [Candidatus Neomarinimicrobiota bacterium]